MKTLYLIILALLISFASIGAVVFTPGLPNIASYFKLTHKAVQFTLTLYLVGYAFGQLIYGPLTNRFGSIRAIQIGAFIEVIGAIGCIASYYADSYFILLSSRFIMALGAACGLKMTFTLSSKLFTYTDSARIMGLLTMAFAITPGLGIYLGGVMLTYYNWTGPFYLMVIYGIAIFLLAYKLPEMYPLRDKCALKPKHIIKNYIIQFKSKKVIFGGLLVGGGTSIVYVFASISPFIAMNIMHLTPSMFGIYSFIPCIGMLTGALTSNYYGKIWSPRKSLKFGLIVSLLGVIILAIMLHFKSNTAFSLFLPMIVIYFGFSFVFGNAAALALQGSKDTGNASAMMSFINMASAFIVVAITGFFNISNLMDLPIIFMVLIGLGFIWYNIV